MNNKYRYSNEHELNYRKLRVFIFLFNKKYQPPFIIYTSNTIDNLVSIPLH